jgi:electron transfer flavoprotein alpha/beta subunit
VCVQLSRLSLYVFRNRCKCWRTRNRTYFKKALAIGANDAIRVNATPTDGFFVAKQLAEVIKMVNMILL